MNKIRIETIFTVPIGENIQFPNEFLKAFYDSGRAAFERAEISSYDALSKELKAGWDESRRYGLPLYPEKKPNESLPGDWHITDFVLEIQRDRLLFGLEKGRVDANFEVTAAELQEELAGLLQKTMHLLHRARSLGTDDEEAITCLAVAIEGDCTIDKPQAAAWAEKELRQLYNASLAPAFQADAIGREGVFLGVLRDMDPADHNVFSWSQTTACDCLTWAQAGFRNLLIAPSATPDEEQELPIYQIFWANQGNPWTKVLSSNRPYFPAQRGEIFEGAMLTAEGDRRCLAIHHRMGANERRLKLGDPAAFAQVEADIIAAKSLSANIRRYRIGAINALLELGVLKTRSDPHELLSYMDDTIGQLDIEHQRFGPEFERAAAELERSGGILGWPGFIVAAAAIVLASLDTWWGIASTYRAEGAKNLEAFAQWSMVAVYGCLLVTCLVLVSVCAGGLLRAYRDLRRTSRSRTWLLIAPTLRWRSVFLLIAAVVVGCMFAATYINTAVLIRQPQSQPSIETSAVPGAARN